MIDSMFQEGTDQALNDQQARPNLLPPRVGFWANFGSSAPRGVGSAVAEGIAFGAELTGAFGQVEGATGTTSAGGMFSTQTGQERKQSEAARDKLTRPGGGVDFSNEAGDLFRARAREIMPDPNTTGTAGQLTAGLTNFATKAVGYNIVLGPMGAFALAGDVGMTEADRLKQQGVDLPTRTKAGAAAGVLAGASVAVPLAGPTALYRFGVGTAVGVGSISGTSLAEREILRAAGYDKLADTFDPLDPVAIAMGFVPGVVGARFGKPVRTDAQMREAAKLTPAEQARSDAYERSPTNLAELERAIKAEKRADVRAELVAELEKQRSAAGRAGVEAAVQADPDLVPAARVMQAADALDAARLTPETDLAGRDQHVSAVEMAADQMGRGDPVEVASVVRPLDGPQEAGTVRLYAAGEAADRPVKLTTDLAAAQAAADRAGTRLHYLDLPEDHPSLVRPAAPESGLAPHATAELPPELAGQLLQRLRSDAPRQTAAVADALRAAREPQEPRATRAPRSEAPAQPQEGAAKAPKPPAQGKGQSEPAQAGQANIDRAAEQAAAIDPDMLVHLDGMDAPVRVGDLLERVKAEAADDVKLGKLLEVAAACDLRA